METQRLHAFVCCMSVIALFPCVSTGFRVFLITRHDNSTASQTISFLLIIRRERRGGETERRKGKGKSDSLLLAFVCMKIASRCFDPQTFAPYVCVCVS